MSGELDLVKLMMRPFSLRYFEAVANMEATLRTGITSVREAGGSDLGVKTAVPKGLVRGPRMQISIVMLSQTGGHGDDDAALGRVLRLAAPYPGNPKWVVDGPDEMRRRVRELVREGADVIKVATSGGVLSPRDDPRHGHFRDDELSVLVAEATAADVYVMAHAQATEGIKAAIRNGIRSIEHGIYLDDEAISMMLERGTWLVPTLSAPRAVLAASEAGARIDEISAAQGEPGPRGPHRVVPPGGRGRRQGRHGDRQRGRPARPQPGGAGPDGRQQLACHPVEAWVATPPAPPPCAA